MPFTGRLITWALEGSHSSELFLVPLDVQSCDRASGRPNEWDFINATEPLKIIYNKLLQASRLCMSVGMLEGLV